MKTLSKLALITSVSLVSACGTDPDEQLCPAGTTLVGEACVPIADGGPSDAGRTDAATDAGVVADAGFDGATLSTSRLDFGRVVVAGQQSLDVVATNQGAEATRIRVGTISGTGGADFAFVASVPVGPSGLTLDPGASVSFAFRFQPSAEGERTAALVFELCDGGCEATLEILGEGVLDAITCSPTALDFGTVNPDACRSESVLCTNGSDYDADLGSAELRTGSSTAFSVGPSSIFPSTLAPSASEMIEVFYCPTAIGSDQGTLDLSVVHPNVQRGDIAVALSGAAGGPDITCSPADIDFGGTELGASRSRTVVCANRGSEDLTISSFAFATGSSADFTLTATSSGVVTPGSSASFTIRYAPSAVGAVTGSFDITSDDRDTPVTNVSLAGEGMAANGCALSLSSPMVDFGGVALGVTVEAGLTLTSTGTGACTVDVVGLGAGSGPSFALASPSGPSALAPGQSLTVLVQFSPTAEQSYTGTLELETSDLNQDYPLVVLLNGAGLGASYPLTVRPSSIDFGATQVACTNPAEQTLRVTNTGAPVVLSASIDASGVGVFTVDDQAVTSLALGTNASADLRLGFIPPAPGAFTSRLILSANGLVPLSVPLSGSAEASPLNVDTFTTGDAQVVDLLLVVDDSCSMQEEQQSLAQTASILINAADGFGADYRIAVTTTDPGDNPGAPAAGTLRGNPRVIEPQSPTRIADLAAAINVGINGSPDEQGLFAAAQAVNDPVLLSGPNAGFLRPNAELVVLILSDEPDFSPLAVQTYVDQLRNRPIGLPNALRIYTISGGLVGCTGPGGSAGPGLRYVEAAIMTGGFDRSICDANYATTVGEIAALTFDPPNRRFTLGAAPAPGSVEVFVDGVMVPARTGTVTAWGVDYLGRTLVFALDAIPSPQSTVRVEYEPFCIPSTCGDGAVQAGEQCDDGDADETNACLSTCRNAVCGDGAVLAGSTEQCDDFNTIGGDGCNELCIVEGCGNGIIEVGEECDDGGANSDADPDACRTSCLNAACHDGVIDSGEACDDGNEIDTDTCVADCVVAFCGDGFVNVPVEQCDDGNNIDTDGCTNNCALNVLSFTVTTIPASPLVPTAGTPITWTSGSADDGFSTIAVGFPFSYLGTAVTNVFPSTNGFVAFGSGATSFTNVGIPNAAAPNGFIAWWWDDLHMDLALTPATVATTALIGVAPVRVRVLTFLNVPRFSSSQGAELLNVEIRLFEGTNVVEVHYGAMTAGTPASFSATAGWESPDGTAGNDVLGCGANCSSASWPTNTIYRYSP